MFGFFRRKPAAAAARVTLPFKSNEAAFEYACKYMDCTITEGSMLPGLIESGPSVMSSKHPDGTQTVMVRVAAQDGGILLPSRTVGEGPLLFGGELVAWLAGRKHPDLAELTGDPRSIWVGLIVGTLKPEWQNGQWIGKDRYTP